MASLVTFGESMLRLSPPRGERVECTDSLDVHVAGAESNVALAAQRLGLDATWLSKLPDSPLARRITNPLHSHDVTTEVVHEEEARQGIYYLEQAGKPRGSNVIYDRADSAITTATVDELPLDSIRDAEMFYTTGITPALSETLEVTTADLLDIAGEAGTETGFDLNYRSKLWTPEEAKETLTDLFPRIDLLVVPERDAKAVLGYEGSAEGIARDLAGEYGFETTIVTRGEKGSLALKGGTVYDQPVYAAETLDPVGTGDAFVGGFLAEYVTGGSVPDALAYGAAAAALKRTIPGDIAVITPQEVERVIEDSSSEISR